MGHTTITGIAVVIAVLFTTAADCQPEQSEITTPKACKRAGGYWAARDCWFGEEAKLERCRHRNDPPGHIWDWDYDRKRCVLAIFDDKGRDEMVQAYRCRDRDDRHTWEWDFKRHKCVRA